MANGEKIVKEFNKRIMDYYKMSVNHLGKHAKHNLEIEEDDIDDKKILIRVRCLKCDELINSVVLD